MKNIIYILMLIMFAGITSAVCTNVTQNAMNIVNSSVTYCYNPSWGNATLNITVSNIVVDGNFSGFVGCYATGIAGGCLVDNYVSHNNVTIQNINGIQGTVSNVGVANDRGNNFILINVTLTGWYTGLQSSGNSATNPQPTVTLINVNISGSHGCLANLWTIGGIWNVTNSHFDNAVNTSSCAQPPHGIYFSDSSGQRVNSNVYINNITANGNANGGLHFNVASHSYSTNHTVYNSQFNNNKVAGIIADSINNSVFTNIQISNSGQSGIALGYGDVGLPYTTANSTFINTTFINSTTRDILYTGGIGNIFINTTWSNILPNEAHLSISSNLNFSIIINDTNSTFFKAFWRSSTGYSPKANLTMNYTGYKQLSIQNSTVTFMGMINANPNNDLQNITNNVTLQDNMNDYTYVLSSSQQVAVGNYYNNPQCLLQPFVVCLTDGNCYDTNNKVCIRYTTH